MPEVRFRIRWPDGSEEECYSPSTVVWSFLSPGQAYPLPDFLVRARSALTRASERVKARHGYQCSSALDQLARIERQAGSFAWDQGAVACLSMTPQEGRP